MRQLKLLFGVVIMFVAFLLFGTFNPVYASEDGKAITATMSTNDTLSAGESVSLSINIKNNKAVAITPYLYSWYYQVYDNSAEYPGVDFGTISGTGFDSTTLKVTIPANGEVNLSMTGVIPSTWNDKSQITVVVSDQQDGYLGQCDYPVIKSTLLSQMNPATDLKWEKPFGKISFRTNNDSGYGSMFFLGGATAIPYRFQITGDKVRSFDASMFVDQSGSYYYVVVLDKNTALKNIEDDVNVKSEEYVYTRPAQAMAAPSNPRWSTKKTMTCEYDSVPNAVWYRVELYDDQDNYIQTNVTKETNCDMSYFMTAGKKYYFIVYAISSDVESIANSPASNRSDYYDESKVIGGEEDLNNSEQSNEGNQQQPIDPVDSATNNQQQPIDPVDSVTNNQQQPLDAGTTATNNQQQISSPENQIIDKKNDSNTNLVSKDEKPAKISVAGIALNKKSVSIAKGKTISLKATVKPKNATNKAVSWKSSNPKIATVDKKGKVKGVKAGTAKITAKTADGNKIATCKITVTEPVKKIRFAKKSYNVKVGKTVTLKTTISPKDATNKKVTYKTSNKKIATVNKNGKVKGIKKGKVTITVTTKDGKKKSICTVYVR